MESQWITSPLERFLNKRTCSHSTAGCCFIHTAFSYNSCVFRDYFLKLVSLSLSIYLPDKYFHILLNKFEEMFQIFWGHTFFSPNSLLARLPYVLLCKNVYCTASRSAIHIVKYRECLFLLEFIQSLTHTAVHVAVPPGSYFRRKEKDSDLTN